MDDYSGKRTLSGLVSKKASPQILRDTANTKDRNAQFCNRTGCSGRLNTKGTSFGYSEKGKILKPSLRSSNGKDIVGSSSKILTSGSKPRKSSLEAHKELPPPVERDSSENSSTQDELDASKLLSSPRKVQEGHHHEPSDDQPGNTISVGVVGSNVAVSTRSRTNSNKKSGLATQDILTGSAAPSVSRSTVRETRGATSRTNLRSIRCNSISDISQSSSSSTDSNLPKRKEVVRKRDCERESSSTKGKRISSPFSSGRSPSSGAGFSITEARRTRNNPPKRENGCASTRTRRLSTNTTARTPNGGGRNSTSTNDLHTMDPQMPQPDVPIDLNTCIPSHHFSAQTSSLSSSYDLRIGGTGLTSVGSSDIASARSSVNLNGFRHYNIDGIAELLLELERMEQEEELTYEQTLVLDSFLYLNGLNFYDRHRDMRLDIDNMSYEELLALEERMGTVSTALPEETLSNCLKRSIYGSSPLEAGTCLVSNKDDTKCSICQEEYVDGDEVGSLHCGHGFHVACIHQWLQLKNWCPICKSSAEPPQPVPS